MSTSAVGRGATVLLALASVAVAFAAADTYVVVLALPDMMTSAGVPIDELQRAAPIVSGFLLGYIAILPLIGRIADLRGRVPVLATSLVIFAVGSLVTAFAYDLPSMVAGRFLQGVGGGGLVPATLALVADLYPVHRRGVPLGIVSAVQELGSVVGPLFGALVLAVANWQTIFAINLVVGALLAIAVRALASTADTTGTPPTSARGRPDLLGLLLLLLATAAAALTVLRPPGLLRDLTWGAAFVPYVDGGRWLSPIGLVAMLALVGFAIRCVFARRPLVDVRGWWRTLREADLVGAFLVAVALGGIVGAFATADPKIQVFSERGWWFLAGSAVASVLVVWHLRTATDPLIPAGAVARRGAWGSLVVSFFVGAALIAALIDIPLFARTTTYPDSQLMAALVLLRFLIALPVGAVVGGWLTRRVSAAVLTCAGMAMAAAGFAVMSRWDAASLDSWTATLPLVLAGFGFGLALAPVNAALLAATDDAVHGVAAALVVVARMVGMLVGISALTTIGLRRFYSAPEALSPLDRAVLQETTVFAGAAVCAVIAGVLALVLLRGVATRDVAPAEALTLG